MPSTALDSVIAALQANTQLPAPVTDPYVLTSTLNNTINAKLASKADATDLLGLATSVQSSKLDIAGNGSNVTFTPAGVGAVSRALSLSLQDFAVNVKNFGVLGDNVTDDTANIRKAINRAVAIGASVIFFPAGIYVISSALVVPAGKAISFEGLGQGASVIRQTNATADGIVFDNTASAPYTTQGQIVRNLTVESGAGLVASNFFGQGSSGRGIVYIHGNDISGIRDVSINGFATGLALLGCWNTSHINIRVMFASGNGLLIDKGPDNTVGGGNRITQGKISNSGFPDGNRTGIGLRIRASGGEYLSYLDLTSFYKAVVVDPRANEQVFALWFDTVLADTSLGDGWTFDSTAGSIISTQCTACWAGFNGNPSAWNGVNGYALASTNLGGHGVVLNGPRIFGFRSEGFRIRENGLAGVLHNAVGATGIEFNGSSVLRNSQITNLAYQGVVVADGAGNIAFNGGAIGNSPGEAGSTNTQSQAFLFNGSHDSVRVIGVDARFPGAGQPSVFFTNKPGITNSIFSLNLPRNSAALDFSVQ